MLLASLSGLPPARAQVSPTLEAGPDAKDARAVAYRVAHIIDGDTVVLLVADKAVRFSLSGVDATNAKFPHKSGPVVRRESTRTLRELVGDGWVYLEREPAQVVDPLEGI